MRSRRPSGDKCNGTQVVSGATSGATSGVANGHAATPQGVACGSTAGKAVPATSKATPYTKARRVLGFGTFGLGGGGGGTGFLFNRGGGGGGNGGGGGSAGLGRVLKKFSSSGDLPYPLYDEPASASGRGGGGGGGCDGGTGEDPRVSLSAVWSVEKSQWIVRYVHARVGFKALGLRLQGLGFEAKIRAIIRQNRIFLLTFTTPRYTLSPPKPSGGLEDDTIGGVDGGTDHGHGASALREPRRNSAPALGKSSLQSLFENIGESPINNRGSGHGNGDGNSKVAGEEVHGRKLEMMEEEEDEEPVVVRREEKEEMREDARVLTKEVRREKDSGDGDEDADAP